MMTLVLTALAGGLGAAARFALDTALTLRWAQSWVRLMIVNASGSALLGLLTGLAADRTTTLVLGAGFLGGYTTFSAASLATLQAAEDGRWAPALAASLGMLLACTLAAALGLLVALSG